VILLLEVVLLPTMRRRHRLRRPLESVRRISIVEDGVEGDDRRCCSDHAVSTDLLSSWNIRRSDGDVGVMLSPVRGGGGSNFMWILFLMVAFLFFGGVFVSMRCVARVKYLLTN